MTSYVILSLVVTLSVAWATSTNSSTEDVSYLRVKTREDTLQLTRYSFTDCGGSSAAVTGWFNVYSTDPITLPGEVIMSFDTTFRESLNSPLRATYTVQKKVWWFWITVRSGSYDDVCSLISPQPSGCPSALDGLPSCQCPFQAGRYAVDAVGINIEASSTNLPSWLLSGRYYIQAKLFNGSTQLGCYDGYLNL